MKPKLYLETTIPSYVVGRLSRNLVVAAHQQVMREWWDLRRSEFDVFVSQFVIDEVRAGDEHLAAQRLELLKDIPILTTRTDVLGLAQELVSRGLIPRKSAIDAVHIAIESAHLRVFANLELPAYCECRDVPGHTQAL